MSDGFTVTVDTSALLAQMDRLGDALDDVCRDVALEAAKRVAFDARARVRRATGVTAEGIHVETARDNQGFVVLGYDATSSNPPVDYWLEYGTKFMTAKPFFQAAAAVEEGAFLRHLEEAVQAKLEEMGF